MARVSLDQFSESAVKHASTAVFNDGYRQIDFILAYHPDCGSRKRTQKVRFRHKFETSMKKEGLELEIEGKENSQDGTMAFIKVHASWQALTRQAELERIQMPIMASDLEQKSSVISHTFSAVFSRIGRTNPFELQPEYRVKREKYFTDAYDRSREDQFLIDDQDHFFSQAQRINLTWSIISGITISLSVKKKKKRGHARDKDDIMDNDSSFSGSNFDEIQINDTVQEEHASKSRVKSANIQYLLNNGTYSDAFPVHDCELNESDTVNWSKIPIEDWPKRKYLRTVWGNLSQWHRHQPLDEIRDYFGEKVAMYYAWLGFYTKMLVVPAIFGIFIVLWGIWHAFNDAEASSFCSSGVDLLFCRACRQPVCPFSNAEDECTNARLSAIIDNWGTTVFSVFMAVWVVVFLEQWKRYQSELRVRWDVSENKMNIEQVRPAYALKVNTTKLNPVTQRIEPFLPKRSLLQRTAISVSSVVFFLFVVLALISTVMAYKVAGPIIWYARLQYKDTKTGSIKVPISPALLTSITASILNGLFIAVMTKIYMKIAWKLTELELPRTQGNFEESFTYKVFIFQFVNFYGALFYLAFVRVFKKDEPHRSDYSGGCPPTGCLLDVSIQLFIIMTGKQAINGLLEFGIPAVRNWLKRRSSLQSASPYARWEQDYDLVTPPGISLFGDYLEMLIQFGFVTMFVPAFPLAPLFALINNIIEIRLDAYNMLVQSKRHVPVRVKDIGTWYGLLTVMSRLAVVTNAFLIALTTTFLDRIAYEFNKNLPGQSDATFFDFILTPFKTQLWCANNETNQTLFGGLESNCTVLRTYDHNGNSTLVDHCYFRAYADPSNNYAPTMAYYMVYLAKFLYAIVFEHCVLLIQAFLSYMIPDVPDHVTVRQQREAFLQRQAFKEHEMGPYGKPEVVELSEEEEFAAEDPNKPWDLASFASNLPKGVAVNKLGRQASDKRRKKARSIYAIFFRKIIACSD